MKIARDLDWIEEFVQDVQDLVPLERLTSIKGYKQRPGKFVASYGGTHTADMQKYNITLLTHEWSSRKRKNVPVDKGMIIDTLAHELAHVVHWEHSWEHYRLQIKILYRWIDLVREKDMVLWSN